MNRRRFLMTLAGVASAMLPAKVLAAAAPPRNYVVSRALIEDTVAVPYAHWRRSSVLWDDFMEISEESFVRIVRCLLKTAAKPGGYVDWEHLVDDVGVTKPGSGLAVPLRYVLGRED